MKKILRVKSSTTNEAIVGELGLCSLRGRRRMLRLNFWQTLNNMDQNRLVKRIYIESKKRFSLKKEKKV